MDTDLELIMYTGTERVTLLRQRLIHSSFLTVVRPARRDAQGKGETVARHPSDLPYSVDQCDQAQFLIP